MSETAEYYKRNPAARRRRNKQQAALNKTPKEKKRRAELNKINRRNHRVGKSRVGDRADVSHLKSGGTTLEPQSRNRRRNGHNGKSSKK